MCQPLSLACRRDHSGGIGEGHQEHAGGTGEGQKEHAGGTGEGQNEHPVGFGEGWEKRSGSTSEVQWVVEGCEMTVETGEGLLERNSHTHHNHTSCPNSYHIPYAQVYVHSMQKLQ